MKLPLIVKNSYGTIFHVLEFNFQNIKPRIICVNEKTLKF